MDLLDDTLNLLQIDKGDWNDTAKQCRVSYVWLCAISQGTIRDPGVRRISRVYNYLQDKHGASQPYDDN